MSLRATILAFVILVAAVSAQTTAPTIVAGGGSSAAAAYIIATAATAATTANKPVSITYNTTSSTVGRTSVVAQQLDFAVSDVAFPVAQYPSNFSQIPFVLGIFSVATDNNINNFRLDARTLAGIYSCNLTTWEQVSQAANQTFSATGRIVPVARSDSSGTTQLITAYMASAGPAAWSLGSGPLIQFPSCVQTASGSANVSALIRSLNRTAIGYLETSIASNSSLISAALKNNAGSFVTPAAAANTTYDNLGVSIPTSVASSAWDSLNLGNSSLPTAYPITSIEYIMVPTNLASIQTKTAGSQSLLKQYIGYLLSSAAQSAAATPAFAGFGTLPRDILNVAISGVNALQTTDTTTYGLPAPSSTTPVSG